MIGADFVDAQNYALERAFVARDLGLAKRPNLHRAFTENSVRRLTDEFTMPASMAESFIDWAAKQILIMETELATLGEYDK